MVQAGEHAAHSRDHRSNQCACFLEGSSNPLCFFTKARRTPSPIIDTVRLFDLRTGAASTVAYLEPYPTKRALKRERKTLLKKN